LAKYFTGRNEETEAHVLEALRISNRDTYAFVWMLFVGFAKLGAGRDEEAITWLNRSIGLNRGHPTPHCLLAAALAQLGRVEEAREAARRCLDLNPSFTIARYQSSNNPVYLAGRERMYEGMRMAGVPEE
jgi:Flp pilus assembly protein TadD